METVRVRRLRELLADTFHGSQTEMSRRTGVSLSQLGQYFCGYRNIGEKVARKIEQGAGKPQGWLDHNDSNIPALTAETQWLLRTWQDASAEAKEVARFALSDTDAPLPPWADKDKRQDLDSMLYAALRWLRRESEPAQKNLAA